MWEKSRITHQREVYDARLKNNLTICLRYLTNTIEDKYFHQWMFVRRPPSWSMDEDLLVDPWCAVCGPLIDAFREPKTNFSFGALDRITSVANISSCSGRRIGQYSVSHKMVLNTIQWLQRMQPTHWPVEYSILKGEDMQTCLNSKIASDCSGGRVSGVSGAEHLAAGHNGVLALPDHCDNRS